MAFGLSYIFTSKGRYTCRLSIVVAILGVL